MAVSGHAMRATSTGRRTGAIGLVGLGGAGAALAADLCLRGARGLLGYDADERIAAAVERQGGIRHDGLGGSGLATGLRCTATLRELVEASDCLILTVTADRHAPLARTMAPWLRPHQLVVLHTGYVGGSKLFLEGLRQAGCKAPPALAETVNTLHLGAACAPGAVYIRGRKIWLELTGLTPGETDLAMARLSPLLPELAPGRSTLETGLNNPNPIGHVPALVGNLGLLGRDLGEATLGALQFDELCSAAVKALSCAFDSERIALMQALGLTPVAVPKFVERAYGPAGRLPAPWPRFGRKLLPRFLHEDIAAACVPMEALGAWCGAPTPLASAFIDVASAATGNDWRVAGRRLDLLDAQWVQAQCEHARGPAESRA